MNDVLKELKRTNGEPRRQPASATEPKSFCRGMMAAERGFEVLRVIETGSLSKSRDAR
jgi:hypothetical protein